MPALSAFYPFVLPYVDGCSLLMADQALVSSAIDFCQATSIVRQVWVDDAVAGTQDYDVQLPPQMVLTLVHKAFYKDRELPGIPFQQVPSAVALQGAGISNYELRTGDPRVYFMKEPQGSTISLYPVPSDTVTNGLTFSAAFAPARTATTLTQILFDDHAECIAYGAIARLASTPAQPFTNSQVAAQYGAMFASQKAEAIRLAETGLVRSTTRTKPVRFA